MVKNGQKMDKKMVKQGQKWSKMCSLKVKLDFWKVKVSQNGKTMALPRLKWVKLVQNGQKYVKNDQKWLKVRQNLGKQVKVGQKGQANMVKQ